jgi:hypothetical protein
MFAYPQPTFASTAQYPQMMSAQPVPQPNPYLAQMQAMQAQMQAMQQYMVSMQASVAAQPSSPAAVAKKTRKPRTPKDPNAPKQPIPEGTSAWISYVQLIRGEIDARMKSVDPTYKGVSWKDSMQEAKRLKDLGDPRYQYTPKPKALATPKQAFTQLPLPTGGASAPLNPPVYTGPTPSITSLPFQGGASAPLNPPAQAAPKKVVRKPATAAAPIAAPTSIPAPVAELFSFPTAPVAAPVTQTPVFDVFAMAPIAQAIEEVTVETVDDLELEEETINGITYLMSPDKECWLMESDGTQGAWAGVYNGTTIDDSIPEPSY